MFCGFDKAQRDILVMKELQASKIEFHLTGSRFFGTERADSDIDLFTKSAPETEDFLRNLGFMKESEVSRRYSDKETVSVWRYSSGVFPYLHIQLVKDPELKQQAQLMLKVMFPDMGEFSAMTWDGAFRYLKACGPSKLFAPVRS